MTDYRELREAAEKAIAEDDFYEDQKHDAALDGKVALGFLDAIDARESEITRLRTALAASEAKLEKARQALKPFASLADGYADGRDDDHHVIGAQVALKDWRVITAGDIRRAATALKDIA